MGTLGLFARPRRHPALRAESPSPIILRDYQQAAVEEFLTKGAVFIGHPPGAGKTFIPAHILSHFVGQALILADSTLLVEQ